jgi:large subunit ribosomal protein L21
MWSRATRAPSLLRALPCRLLLQRGLCSAVVRTPPPAPPPPPTRFAVVALSGTQYKVAPDDLICVEKLELPVGATMEARRVLLVGEAQATIIGSPLIENALVRATVEEQGYGKKVIVFKKRRRKGYRRWRGFRGRFTLLRINAIELPPALEASIAGSG